MRRRKRRKRSKRLRMRRMRRRRRRPWGEQPSSASPPLVSRPLLD